MQIETNILDTLHMIVINETSRQSIHTVLIGEDQYSVYMVLPSVETLQNKLYE